MILLAQLQLVHPVGMVDDHHLPEDVLPPDVVVLLVLWQQVAPTLVSPVFWGKGLKEGLHQAPVALLRELGQLLELLLQLGQGSLPPVLPLAVLLRLLLLLQLLQHCGCLLVPVRLVEIPADHLGKVHYVMQSLFGLDPVTGVNKKPQKFIFEYWVFSQKSYLNVGCFEEIHICIPKI